MEVRLRDSRATPSINSDVINLDYYVPGISYSRVCDIIAAGFYSAHGLDSNHQVSRDWPRQCIAL